MGALNKSSFWIGEPIRGSFVITVDQTDPGTPTYDLLNAGLEMIFKKSKSDLDVDSLALLTNGDGLTILENSEILYEVVYVVPGSATSGLEPLKPGDNSRDIYYEINLTIAGQEALGSDVLESGTIKIKLDRVKEIN